MDINTLPDEMLTNILKHTEFDCGRMLRKMNQRINRLASRANLFTQLTVESLRLLDTSIELKCHGEEYTLEKYEQATMESNNDCQRVLGKRLSEIRVSESIEVNLNVFNNDIVAILKKNQSLRDAKKIRLCRTNITVSNDIARIFMNNVSPKVDVLEIIGGKGADKLCTIEVLGNRKWEKLFISSPEPKLDDDFLLKVVVNCRTAYISEESFYTVIGVVNMMKECLTNLEYYNVIALDIVKLGIVTRGGIIPLLQSELPGLRTEEKVQDRIRWYTIYFSDDSNKYLRFGVEVDYIRA